MVIIINQSGEKIMLHMTQHAQARMQQRGIPASMVSNLLDYGRETYNHRGSRVVYFDHRSRKQLLQQLGSASYKKIETYLDTYAVLGMDGALVTVGHRTRRINRH